MKISKNALLIWIATFALQRLFDSRTKKNAQSVPDIKRSMKEQTAIKAKQLAKSAAGNAILWAEAQRRNRQTTPAA